METYNQFLVSKTISMDMAEYLYRALNSKGKYNEAIQVLLYMTQYKFDDAYYYYNEIGSIYLYGLINPNKAMEYFQTSIKINPKQSDAMILLADAYEHQNQISKALEIYNKALALSKSDPNAFMIQNRIKAIELSKQKQLIKDWLVLGPFDNTHLNGLNIAYRPEADIQQTSYDGKNGIQIKWQRPYHPYEYGYVNLNTIFSQNDYGIAYALTYVYSPREKEIMIHLGSDDGIRIWINDQIVFSLDIGRRVILDSDHVPAKLRPGWNKIMLKISESWGGWGFYFRVTDIDSYPISDLVFDPEKKQSTVDQAQKQLLLKNIYFGILLFLIVALSIWFTGFLIRSLWQYLKIKKMKDDFLQAASHDMKTPLTSIRMYAETLLLGRIPEKEKERKYLSTIIQEVDALTDFINNILDFSKLTSSKVQYRFVECDIQDFLEKVIADFKQKHSTTIIEFEYSPMIQQHTFRIDPNFFKIALFNLLDNAIKYSPQEPWISISCYPDRNCISIAVQDRGMGIPKKDLKKIFKKFYRCHIEQQSIQGTGLGLSIVQKIVLAHEGKIELMSELGQGSTFTIKLKIQE